MADNIGHADLEAALESSPHAALAQHSSGAIPLAPGLQSDDDLLANARRARNSPFHSPLEPAAWARILALSWIRGCEYAAVICSDAKA